MIPGDTKDTENWEQVLSLGEESGERKEWKFFHYRHFATWKIFTCMSVIYPKSVLRPEQITFCFICITRNQIFFFCFLWPHMQLMEVPSQRSNQSCSCWPTPQPRQCRIWARSVTYTTARGNTGSLTHWVGPGSKPTSSWMLVRFISAEPWRELLGGINILKQNPLQSSCVQDRAHSGDNWTFPELMKVNLVCVRDIVKNLTIYWDNRWEK